MTLKNVICWFTATPFTNYLRKQVFPAKGFAWGRGLNPCHIFFFCCALALVDIPVIAYLPPQVTTNRLCHIRSAPLFSYSSIIVWHVCTLGTLYTRRLFPIVRNLTMREAAVTSTGVDRHPPYRSSETKEVWHAVKLSGSLMFALLFPLVTILLPGCRLTNTRPGLLLVIIFSSLLK